LGEKVPPYQPCGRGAKLTETGGNLEGGLPAAGGDGGVEGLEDGAGPEAGGLLPRGRGLAGDARDGGLGAEDAGEGVRRLLSVGNGRGGRRLRPLAAVAGSRNDGSPGRRVGGRGRRRRMHGASARGRRRSEGETAIRSSGGEEKRCDQGNSAEPSIRYIATSTVGWHLKHFEHQAKENGHHQHIGRCSCRSSQK